VLAGMSNRGLRTHLEKHNVQLIIPTIIEIVDSTPLEDPSDPDARKGKNSKDQCDRLIVVQ